MAAPRFLARRLAAPGPSRIAARYSSTAASAPAHAAFEPALPAGAEPAYDLALAYIEEQNAISRKRLDALRAKVAASPSPELERRIARLEVEAWVNDPATRRLFRETNGAGHMDRPVIRSLAERAWRTQGELDKVMQRVNQLGVVPDLVPDHTPHAALRIAQATGAAFETGAVMGSTAFANPPVVSLQMFNHPVAGTVAAGETPEAKFTLLVVDPDSPNHEEQAYTQRVHYAKTDIPLSVMSGTTNLFTAAGNEALSYEPPAPARGTGKHRYVFVVIRQQDGGAVAAPSSREDFDMRAFLAANDLTDADVYAINLFRSQWAEEDAEHVDATYRNFRGEDGAPDYAKPPKELKYGYPLSAMAVRYEAVRQEAWNGVIAEIEAMEQGMLPGQEEQQPLQ